jgi:hypothetical protein
MRAHTAVRWMALSCLLPSLTGCALLFVQGPPDNHEELDSFSCTESRVAPILDLIMAGSSFLAAGQSDYYVQPEYYSGGTGYVDNTDHTPDILGALLYGVSGAVGLGRVSACRKAKQELRDRLAARAQAARVTPVAPGQLQP